MKKEKNENDLIPIDTFYAGKLFKSRTEARWAVFFDKLEWEWEYELEAFSLPSGAYLPDFYFPKLNVFAEVKPTAFTEIELKKCKELSELNNNRIGKIDVVLLDGVPKTKTYDTLSAGMFYQKVVLVNKDDGYFFGTDKFNHKRFLETINATNYATSARFEFEWKERTDYVG